MAQSGEMVYLLVLLLTYYQLMENDASTAATTDTTDFSVDPVTTTSQPISNASFYCDAAFECSDPFTFKSDNSLEQTQCACREGWLTTRTCCLSQWWFIGLACGGGAILLLAFIIAIGCCCCYKSDAKKAKAAAKHAPVHSNHKTHDDIELHDTIKSPHIEPSTAAMATFAANEHDADHKTHDDTHLGTVHSTHSIEAEHVTPAHVTPASHGNDHVAPAEAHPVAATAAVAAVVHEARENQTHNPQVHHDSTPVHHATGHEQTAPHVTDPKHHPVQLQAHSPPHQYQYSNGGPSYQDQKQYNRYLHQPYQGHTDPYYPPNRQQPYGGYSNSRYSEDNDSLETYDDTALPSTNYNNYHPGPGSYNYGGPNGSSNKKNHPPPNSSLLKIDSTSQFVINRPSVIL